MQSRQERSLADDYSAVTLELTEGNLGLFARGCAVLGAGGGGDPQIGLIMALGAVARHGPVALVDVDDLPDDGLIMPCGLIGAPTVTVEKIWIGDEGARLRAVVEELWDRPVTALMCFEIAGSNGLLPVAWAAELGLPVVNADGMGRAFPEIHQQTMHLAGVSASPFVLVDERANEVVLRPSTNEWAERLARDVVASFGGVAAASVFQMPVERARGAVIRGSMTRALEVGRALAGTDDEPVRALLDVVGGVELLAGKVVEVERRTTGRFARGSAVIEGSGTSTGRLLRLELQNEVLVALLDGSVVASVPDVISVLDAHSGDAIGTERLRYGQRVNVIAFPCDPVWATPQGLALVGPGAFDYDFGYVPVSELAPGTHAGGAEAP